MGLGAFLGGAAQEGTNQVHDYQDRAFKLKLLNAQMEASLSSQKSMADYNANIEKEKYNREGFTSGEVSGGIGEALKGYGVDLGLKPGQQLSEKDTGSAMGLLGHLQQKKATMSATAPASNDSEIDPTTGLKVGTNIRNQAGVIVKRINEPGFPALQSRHAELAQFAQAMDHAKGLFDSLSMPGGGLAGKGLNKVAELSSGAFGLKERDELQKAQDATSILAGKFLDKVPGGRASLGLGEGSKSYQIRPETNPKIVRNIYDNSGFQVYRDLKSMGSTTVVPETLSARFDWLPHDVNGVPTNVRFKDGQAYLGDSKVPLARPNQQVQRPLPQVQAPKKSVAETDNPFSKYGDADLLNMVLGGQKTHEDVQIKQQKEKENKKGN